MARSFKILPLFCLILLAGCVGYESLDTPDDPVRLAILPIQNESELPQIIAPLARNVREKVAHARGWELSSEANAEAALRITVSDFNRYALARDPGDTGRPLSYFEEFEVKVEWISELPAPWGPDPEVTITTDQIMYSQPSLTNAESVAMAEIADRLAEKILQRLDWAGSGQ